MDVSSPPVSLHSGGPESVDLNKSSTSIKTSLSSDALQGSESSGEIIARFELDITCILEKLTNLNSLMMHVEIKESDFEAFVSSSDMDHDLTIKALEFDFLSGLLNSEVRVLEKHISDCITDKAKVMELLSSYEQSEDMLSDSEKSLEQSLELLSDIKVRSAHFEKNLSRFSGHETRNDDDYIVSSNNGELLELNEKMKMHTVEHRRQILKMLNKSLEKEIELEKRLSESTQIQETLTMRLHASVKQVIFTEEETEMTLEKFYEADHTSDLLMSISKQLLSFIKLLQFNLRGSLQREMSLKSDLLALEEKSRVANTTESSQQLLTDDTSQKLETANEKVVLLEKELSITSMKLQNVEACFEAGQEDRDMLNAQILDMLDVMEDMKNKVSEAKNKTESMEDQCIFLSESNENLKKELNFFKAKVNTLETSLHKMEETKKATAKDITLRTKLITDLVMQMALERERLQKQMSSLKHDNKILVACLKKTEESSAVKVSDDDFTSVTDAENKESLSTTIKPENTDVVGSTDSASELEVERNIDARELKRKGLLLAFLVLIFPLLGTFLYKAGV